MVDRAVDPVVTVVVTAAIGPPVAAIVDPVAKVDPAVAEIVAKVEDPALAVDALLTDPSILSSKSSSPTACISITRRT